MKKLILAFSMLVFAASGTTYALELNSFNVDEEFAIAEFAELDELEATVQTANLETMTYQEIVAKSEFNEALFLRDGISGDDGGGFSLDDMDWASFAWGFCCCPVGFFVVAINKNKDKDQKVSYWIGYGVSALLSIISTVATAAGGA
jgi:hypothetical protein